MSAKQQGLLLGTILMLFSNIIVKGLGFAYRVILVRLLGTEGVGLIEMVSPLFSFLLVFAGLGIQPALSQKVASTGDDKQIFMRTAQIMLLFSGILLTLAGFGATDFMIAHFVPDQRIYHCFRLILPAIAVISVAAAYRGWFQGMRQVSVIGGSQTIEQLVRVIIGVYLAEKLLNLGLEQAVSAASLATVCGETAGFLYLFCRFHGGKKAVFKKPKPRFSWAAAAQLLRYGMPITAGKMISSGIMMLQAFLIPLSLQVAGWDMRAATEIYGRFSGVALSMLHLPGVFTTALAVSVLPAVAESMNFAHNGRQLLAQRIGQSLTATAIFTLPGMAILFLLAEPLCTWIFANPPAAPILKLLALGGSFFYLQLTLVSILQGLGAVKPLLINNIISGLILLAGIALLTSSPRLGILGTAIAVDIAWISGMLLNLRQVIIISRVTLPWKQILIKPLLALIGALLLFFFAKTWLLSLFTNDKIAILLLSSCFFASYLLLLVLQGGLKLK